MLSKSQIFYFLISLIATVAIGFFIWSLFIIPNNGVFANVLAEINKVGFKFFPASIQSDYKEVELSLSPVEEEVNQGEQKVEPDGVSVYYTNDETTLTEEGRQNILDDIQEKLDVISQQVQQLIAEKNEKEASANADKKELVNEEKPVDEKDEGLEEHEEIEETEEIVSCVGQINVNTASVEGLEKIIGVGAVAAQKIIEARPFCSLNDLLRVSGIGETTLQKITEQQCAYADGICGGGGGGGGGSAPLPTVYSKILISEIQISPIAQRFVELYNPSATDIDLTGWYLQRKTETADTWGSLVSSPKFEGKIIPANGYFLISRELEASDILFDITLSDNNSLALKNPDGEVSDKLGFGSSQDFETQSTTNPGDGQSIGRKYDSTEQDTNDNSVDFELNTPTPKSKNTIYVAPSVPTLASIAVTTPATKLVYNVGDTLDISGLVITGTYSDLSTKTETINLTDVTGFDSSIAITDEILTITINGQTTTYKINIVEPVLQKAILINEIQIAGQTAKDEFIELYNPNSFDVDLVGFSLKRKTSSGVESNLVSAGSFVGTILAGGYFLIAPQVNDDGSPSYMGSVTPNLYYSGKTYSIALNNTVLFYDKNGSLQDKVGFGTASDFEAAVALNPDDGKSISRTTGTDTEDNSEDFVVLDTPTPGQ